MRTAADLQADSPQIDSASDSRQAPPGRDERISQAIDEFLVAAEAGIADRAALLAKYQDVADELIGCLDTFDFVNKVAPSLSEPSMIAGGKNSPTLSPLATLGDFRIVREIGRGGMGVVYEAEQLSLGRRMALKVLPFAAMLDKQQLKRFKNEARAAATLDHPHIVAVHSVGEERGVHYYAMQLVEGQSLAEVIQQRQMESVDRRQETGDRGQGVASGEDATAAFDSALHPPPFALDTRPVAALSTVPAFDTGEYFRSVAELGVQAARALDYAHQNGIVHRDVKPGNLMIDAEGKLFVTDFGLARMESDAGMTITGDLLGTLAYMSPEQALAKRVIVDHRTDIYSLGVTLYELISLRKPYDGIDRQELLKKIAFDEPRQLRRINGRIPEDLATIVSKAIEKRPDDRYATAQELAEDLQRFLSDQPIQARPPTIAQRLGKWSRRHLAAVRAAAACLTLLGVVVVWLMAARFYEIQTARAAIESSLDQARAAMAVDEAALAQTAVAKAKDEADRIGDADSPLRRRTEALQRELDRFEEFTANYELARWTRDLTELNAERALAIYNVMDDADWLASIKSSTAPPEFIDHLTEQVYELLILRAHVRSLGAKDPASEEAKLKTVAETRAFLDKASTIRAPSKGYYWVLASCSQRMGDVTAGETRVGHDAEALRLRALAEETPPQTASDLALIVTDRSWGCASPGERPPFRWPISPEERQATYREMLRIEPTYVNALFMSSYYLDENHQYEAAVQGWNGYLASRPDDHSALHNRSLGLLRMGFIDEAAKDRQRVVQLKRETVKHYTNSKLKVEKEELAGSLGGLAYVLLSTGDIPRVRSLLAESLAMYESLAEESTDPEAYAKDRARVAENMRIVRAAYGDSLADHGDWTGAAEQFRLAVDERPDDHDIALAAALMQLAAGDRQAYVARLAAINDRFENVSDGVTVRDFAIKRAKEPDSLAVLKSTYEQAVQLAPDTGDGLTAELQAVLDALNAAQHSWVGPAQFRVFMQRQPAVDAEIGRDHLRYAPLLIRRGDDAGYDRFRRALAARFEESDNSVNAERMVRIALLWAPSPDILEACTHARDVLVASLDNEETDREYLYRPWNCIALAMFAYRHGDWVQGVEWCEKDLQFPALAQRDAMAYLLLALNRRQLGEPSAAAAAFDEADQRILAAEKSGENGEPAGNWFDWEFAAILREELFRPAVPTEPNQPDGAGAHDEAPAPEHEDNR